MDRMIFVLTHASLGITYRGRGARSGLALLDGDGVDRGDPAIRGMRAFYNLEQYPEGIMPTWLWSGDKGTCKLGDRIAVEAFKRADDRWVVVVDFRVDSGLLQPRVSRILTDPLITPVKAERIAGALVKDLLAGLRSDAAALENSFKDSGA